MRDCYQRAAGTRLKGNIDHGLFGGREVGQAPFEHQSLRWLPDRDPAGFEHLVPARGLERLKEPTAQLRLQVHDTPLLAQPVPKTASPPSVDLFSEDAECFSGRHLDQ